MAEVTTVVMGKDETLGWITTVADGLAAALASGSHQQLNASAASGVEILRELVRRLRAPDPEMAKEKAAEDVPTVSGDAFVVLRASGVGSATPPKG